MPARIETLEKEQAAITGKLSDAAIYTAQPDEAKRLQQRNAQIEDELLTALTRWEELGSKG